MTLLCDEPRSSAPPDGRIAAPRGGAATLTVAQVLYRWSRCGLELQLAAQAPFLLARGIRPLILSSMPAEPLSPVVADGALLRCFDGPRRGRQFAAWLEAECREQGAALLHARGLWMAPDALRAARRLGGLPVVVSFHGFDDASRNASWLRRQLWRRAIAECAACIAVSRATAAELEIALSLPRGSVHVAANGVDTEHFRPATDRAAAKRSAGLRDDLPLLLCVGSLMPVKGYDRLIEALAQTGASLPPWQLAFVGTDQMDGALQRLAAARLPDRCVRFFGNQADPRPFYHAADVLAVPSRSEGMSNVVLEAMSSGLAVVATAVGGTPELLTDGATGRLVAADRPDELAAAIRELLSHPDAAGSLGAAARRAVARDFCRAAAAGRYSAIYRAAAAASLPC